MSHRTMRWIAIFAIVLAGAIAYANSFNREFIGLDAKESIRDNPHIRVLWPLSESMSLDLLDETLAIDEGAKGGTLVRRPFLSFLFALNYKLSGGDARGFHAVNVLIHIAAGLVLFGIVRRTLERYTRAAGARATVLAGVVAVLWVVHPLQTEAVTNVVQRAESMMGLCLLLALYCALRGFDSPRPMPWYAGATAACAAGMGMKETMVVAPVVVLLYDYTFVSPSFAAALRRHAGLHLGLAATWLILIALIVFTAHDAAKDFQEGKTLPYVLAQPAVILEYLRLSLWPHPLYMYVNTTVWAVVAGVTPSWRIVVPGMVVLVLLGITATGLWRRRWWGFAGAWFFVILAPTSSFVATSDVIQEHRMYLSLAAVIVLVVLAADLLLRRFLSSRQAAATGVIVATAVAALFVWRVQARNVDYRTEFAMIHPDDMRNVHAILAQHELARGRLDLALEQFRAAHEYIPTEKALAEAHYDLGNLLLRYGHDELARKQFELSVETNPRFGDAHNNLAAMLAIAGDLDGARAHLREALQWSPRFPAANNNLGLIELKAGNLDAAIEQFEEALRIIPQYEAARKTLALVERSRDDPRLRRFDLAFDVPAGYGDVAIRLRRVAAACDDSPESCANPS